MSAEDLISEFDPFPVRGVLGSSAERGFHRQHWVNILSYNFSAWYMFGEAIGRQVGVHHVCFCPGKFKFLNFTLKSELINSETLVLGCG